MGKPAALEGGTVSEIKAWINQPKNAGIVAAVLIAIVIISSIISHSKYNSIEAAAIARAVEIATQQIDPLAAQFEASQKHFPFGNADLGLPPAGDRSWGAPLVVVDVRSDGTVYFEYANPRGGYESNPAFQYRLRDGDQGKAGSCIAQRVSLAALEKNGLNCEDKPLSATPPAPPVLEGLPVAAADPGAPAVAPDGSVAPEAPVAPTAHLGVSRDVVDADHVIAAIDRDDADAIKSLKAAGIAVCEPNPEGRLPIVEAARSGQMKSLAYLISVPCGLQQLEPFSQSTALTSAISLRNAQAANALLAAGADPNFAPPGKPVPWLLLGDGEEPEIMHLRDALNARGVNLNATSSDGSTLLIRAAGRGSLDMVRWLISRNADLNAQDKRGRSAVMQAALNATPDSIKILQALIAAKADLNLRDSDNFTVLARVMVMTEDPVRQKEIQQILRSAGAKG